MITVFVASYGYAHLAGGCVESLLSQTRKPDRIVLVDDAAHDRLEVVGEIYGLETIIRDHNMGTTANFDDLLKNHVDGGRMMMLGADNWLRPDALEKMAAVDADIVSTDITITGEWAIEWARKLPAGEVEWRDDGYPIWRFHQKDIAKDNYIHGSSLYNVEKAKRVGYKGNDINGMCEDWYLWRGMLLEQGATHTHIAEPLLYYRRHRHNFNKVHE